MNRVCERCGSSFVPAIHGGNVKRFCSKRCKDTHYKQERQRLEPAYRAQEDEYKRLWWVRERARRQMAKAVDPLVYEDAQARKGSVTSA